MIAVTQTASLYGFSENGFEILRQDENSMLLRYVSQFHDMSRLTDASGLEYEVPQFEYAFSSFPKINEFPFYSNRVNFIVPSPTAFRYKVKRNVSGIHDDIRLLPVPAYIFNAEEDYSDNFINNVIPDRQAVEFVYQGVSGGQHIASLWINPFRYSRDNYTAVIIDTLEIEVFFDNSHATLISNVNDFNYLTVLNYEMGKNWSAYSDKFTKKLEELQSEDDVMNKLSNGQWAKIEIIDEGVYKIDGSDLQNIGFTNNSELARTVKIFGKGGAPLSESVSDGLDNRMDEQEIIVKTNSSGGVESIIFYGASVTGFEKRGQNIRHYKNFYSEKNYYLITWGGVDGKRAEALPIPEGEIANRPTTYREYGFFDEDIVNPYSPGAGRDWFGRSFFSTPLPPLMLHDLDRNGEVEYRIAVAHKSLSQGFFYFYENNEPIGSVSLTGWSKYSYVSADRRILNAKVPANSIASDNRSILKLQYQNALISSIGYFDYYEISYPRSFFAINNKINIIADNELNGNTEYSINGFNGEIYGFDVSDIRNPKLLTNKAVTGGMFSFVTELNSDYFKRFFIAANPSKPKLEAIEIVNLRDNDEEIDIVVITHKDLLGSANKFKEYRELQSGKNVAVFSTEHIYNEFSSGVPDPTAIRDFLINIYHRRTNKPKYLVLWGDGHYDYRNISTKKVNYIPAYQTYRHDIDAYSEIHEAYATDDYFALIDGDDLLVDINFGRVTIDNPDDGYWVVDKIKHYETASSDDIWRSNMIFVADDGPADGESYEGGRHSGQTENLQANYISKSNPDLQYDKIYLAEYQPINASTGRRKPAVTEAMLTKINTTGGLILNWIGHGNPRVWAHEQILDRDITIPQMRNLDKLFFLTAATCDFGRFDDPDVRSGAEDLFLSKNGGAIGVFSATRVVYSDDNAKLAYGYFAKLLERSKANGRFPSLGETIKAVKQNFASDNDRKYFLVGDPTMTLLFPDHKINIASINEEEITGDTDTINLKALSKVTIEGFLSKPLENNPDESYNGTIVVTLRDGDVLMTVQEVFLNLTRSPISFRKLGGSLNRSSYKVENGRFTAEFIIPKDISFSDSPGRLFLYSVSDDSRYGSGSYHNLRISGFSDVELKDTVPPEISIYLDGRSFESGDMVTTNPLLLVDLFDESGINTTGLGIGHRIEAWIDDSPMAIDLTDKFTSSLSDSRRGTVEDILYGLTPGTHKIKIRAWDVFNNFSVEEVSFVIPEKSGGLVSDITNSPNPFSESTEIIFRHNAEAPFDANIDIFTINGVFIRNINTKLSTLHTSRILWDGLDNSGNKAADGVYMVNVKIHHNGGTSIGRGKLIKVGN